MESTWIETLSFGYRKLLLEKIKYENELDNWIITHATRVTPKFGSYDPNYLRIWIYNINENKSTEEQLLNAKLGLERNFQMDLTWFQTTGVIGTAKIQNYPRWGQFWIIIRDIENTLSWGRIK